MSHVFGFVVCSVEIIDSAYQAGIHDGEILIGERYVDHERRFVTVEELDKLGNAVGIYHVGREVGFADFLDNVLALLAGA